MVGRVLLQYVLKGVLVGAGSLVGSTPTYSATAPPATRVRLWLLGA